MTVTAAFFFVLGFAASWVSGRFVDRHPKLIQSGAIGFCAVAALFFGMPGVLESHLIWALLALFAYGLIGEIIFRSGQAAREGTG